jgi:hypothetical protein
VLAALRALVAFLKKTHYANIRWQGHRELNGRLSVLTQPWGGKEEVGQWGSGMGAGASELAAVMQVTSPRCMSCQRARQTDHSQYAEGLTLHEKQNEESYNVPLWEQDLGFRLIASNGMISMLAYLRAFGWSLQGVDLLSCVSVDERNIQQVGC